MTDDLARELLASWRNTVNALLATSAEAARRDDNATALRTAGVAEGLNLAVFALSVATLGAGEPRAGTASSADGTDSDGVSASPSPAPSVVLPDPAARLEVVPVLRSVQ